MTKVPKWLSSLLFLVVLTGCAQECPETSDAFDGLTPTCVSVLAVMSQHAANRDYRDEAFQRTMERLYPECVDR